MAPVRQEGPAQRRRAAALRRDGALNRLSSITAAIAVASLGAVAGFGIYVAKALPGHHSPPTSGASGAVVPAGNTAQGSGTSDSSNSVNPPANPPRAASAPPSVTSGST